MKSGSEFAPCDGFFKTRGGNFLRGAVLGHGNVPVYQVLNIIKDAGYNGYITLEFEGHEDAVTACKWGLNTLKAMCEDLKW